MKNIFTQILFIYIVMIFVVPFIDGFSSGLDENESTGANDYARITDVDYKAVLVDEPGNGGNLVITERLTFDIHAADPNNLFWELWRALPESVVDGLKVSYDVNYVKQILDDGTELSYQESDKLYWNDWDYTDPPYGPHKWYHSKGPYNESLRRYECVLFYVDGLYRETVTFEIQYTMYNAALRYADVSELYLVMYSEETIEHLNSFDAEILIPNYDMPKRGNYLARTYGTNSHSYKIKESAVKNPGYHTFYFSLDEDDLQFKTYNQYIEFLLLGFNEDRHTFTNYAPNNSYSSDVYLNEALASIHDFDVLPAKFKLYKFLVFTSSIFISLFIILWMIKRDKRLRKKYNLCEPTQKIDYFRDIPSDLDPYFAANLVFSKHKKNSDVGDGYSAILLNLVRKGYIELIRIDESKGWINKNISIRLLYEPVTTNNLKNMKNIPVVPYKSTFKAPTSTVIGHLDNNSNPIDTAKENIPSDLYKTAFGGSAITLSNLRPTSAPKTTNVDTSLETKKVDILTANVTTPQPSNTTSSPYQVKRVNNKGKQLESLSINEEAYFNLIVKHTVRGVVALDSFQRKVYADYINTDRFVKTVENSILKIGINHKYFQKVNYNEICSSSISLARAYLIIGIILLTIVNFISITTRLDLAYGAFFILGFVLIISSIYLRKTSYRYVLFTQYGEDEYAKWRGLYNFLNSETLMKERTVVELPLWEKYLVYATAFGISNKVIKALEIRCPDVNMSPVLGNNYYRSTSFRTNSNSFRSATSSASSRTRSYSSGGYYGGGRGGGGGGGGH